MEIKTLFQKITDDENLIFVLEQLGMHHIKDKGEYISCGMPTGDNTSSVVVYKDNLWVNAYTRDIADSYGNTNLISLISFVKELYFTQSIKWICDICNYDYYEEPKKQTGMLQFLDYIYSLKNNSRQEKDEIEFLKPINQKILKYYGFYCNEFFYKDNISYQTQKDFELGYDLKTHSITIPIRDELSTLVGIKARLYKEKIEPYESKYFYLISCAKSKILYGLYKTIPYIKRQGSVYIVESEKAVMQLWSAGIRNVVATGGHDISKTQLKKIVQTGVKDIVLCFDKDVYRKENGEVEIEEYKKVASMFLPCQNVYGMIDINGSLLDEKQSPTDNLEKFYKMDIEKILLNKQGE